jgi:hypothetical protein
MTLRLKMPSSPTSLKSNLVIKATVANGRRRSRIAGISPSLLFQLLKTP